MTGHIDVHLYGGPHDGTILVVTQKSAGLVVKGSTYWATGTEDEEGRPVYVFEALVA